MRSRRPPNLDVLQPMAGQLEADLGGGCPVQDPVAFRISRGLMSHHSKSQADRFELLSLQFQRFGTAPKPGSVNECNVSRIDQPDDGIIDIGWEPKGLDVTQPLVRRNLPSESGTPRCGQLSLSANGFPLESLPRTIFSPSSSLV
jgi:hypothetical protein